MFLAYIDPGSGSILIQVILATIIGGVFLLPTIFYLLSIQTCLSRCSEDVRTLSPGLVWLMLIPLFNLIWHFIIVSNVTKSVRGEFEKRGIMTEPNPGQGIGLAMCILSVCCLIPIINIIVGIPVLVLWIIYWVKVADYSAKLAIPTTQTNMRPLRVASPQAQMINCPLCSAPIPASRVVIGQNTCPRCRGTFNAEG